MPLFENTTLGGASPKEHLVSHRPHSIGTDGTSCQSSVSQSACSRHASPLRHSPPDLHVIWIVTPQSPSILTTQCLFRFSRDVLRGQVHGSEGPQEPVSCGRSSLAERTGGAAPYPENKGQEDPAGGINQGEEDHREGEEQGAAGQSD